MTTSKLTISQMEAFCAIAKYKSFKQAANKLGISQPSLVNKIGLLEEMYEAKLFIRQRENNRLTQLGEELLPIFKSSINSVREAEFLMFFHGKLQMGEIHIGAVSPYQVSKVIKVFNEQYPNIKVKVSFASSNQIRKLLSLGEIDAAFIVQTEKVIGQQSFHYFDYRLVAILPSQHKLASKSHLFISDFEGQPFICREEGSLTREMFESALSQEKTQVRVVYELGSRESIREAVGQGLGISVVAEGEHVPHDNITVKDIQCPQLTTSSSLVVLNERVSTPLTKALIETVQCVAKNQP